MSLIKDLRIALGNVIAGNKSHESSGSKGMNAEWLAQWAATQGMEYIGNQFSALGDVSLSLNTFYSIHKNNLIVRRYYRKVSKMVAKYGFTIVTTKDGKQVPIANPEKYMPAINEFFAIPTLDVLKQKVFTQAFCSGQVFGIIGEQNLTGEKKKVKILDTRAIDIATDGFGTPIAYTYNANDAGRETFMPEDIVDSLVFYDHDTEYKGTSLYNGLVVDALSDKEMAATSYYFFKNRARPDTIVMLSDDLLNNKEELAEFKKQWIEKYQGSKNSGKPVISAGIRDVKTLEIGASDMKNIEQRVFNDTRVAICYGIDKRLVGYDKENGGSRAEIDVVSQVNGNAQIREYASILEDFMTSTIKQFLFPDWTKLDYRIAAINDEFSNPVKDKEIAMKEVGLGLRNFREYREEFDMDTDGLGDESNMFIVPKNYIPLKRLAVEPQKPQVQPTETPAETPETGDVPGTDDNADE